MDQLEHTKDIELFLQLFNNSIKDIAIIDEECRFVYANQSYLDRTGYDKDELIGKRANILKSGYHDDSFYKKLWDNLNANKNFNAIFTNKNKNGTLYYEEQTIIPMGEVGENKHYLVIGVDSACDIADQLNNLCMQDI